MPDTGCLFLSLVSITSGVLLVLYPNGIAALSNVVNRTLDVLDRQMLRYRYVSALLAFAGSYAFFKLSLLLPMLR